MANKNKLYFAELDGVRTLACALVLIGHCLKDFFKILEKYPFFDNPVFSHFKTAVGAGKEGVSIFFVLSGFLITYLLLKEIEKNGKVSLWKFYMRRVLRIWPLYYAVMIFGLFLYPMVEQLMGNSYNQDLNYLYNLIFLNNIAAIQSTANESLSFWPHIAVAWSVAIEEQFYLFWPLLFLIKPTKKSIPVLFLVVLLISIAFYVQNQDRDELLYFHLLGQIHNLLWGGVVAFLIFYFEKIKLFFVNMDNKVRLAIYAVGFLIYVFRYDLSNIIDFYLLRTMLTFAYAFLIVDQTLSISKRLKFNKDGFFVKWGKYTYGIYLLHFIALLFFKNVFEILRAQLGIDALSYKENLLSAFVVGVASIALTFIVAKWSYIYYETPFLNLKNKFSRI